MIQLFNAQQCKSYLKCRFYHFWQTVVFAALSEYLHQAMFTDVVLVVGHQRLRAHKVVLSSSCKFFRDAFKHHPGILWNHNLTNWINRNLYLLNWKSVLNFVFLWNITGVTCIDLNKELAANDLSLTFEDVQQIICILYCVGTVDISPQKVASLRLIAQVFNSTI